METFSFNPLHAKYVTVGTIQINVMKSEKSS